MIKDLVIDCRHPASLARFWAAVLDDYEVAPYDDAELARLRGLGIFDVEDDPSVVVERADGAGPRLLFLSVPLTPAGRNFRHGNRVRFALVADDRGVVDRLTGLGARVLSIQDDAAVLADPEGNEFRIAWR